MIFQCVTLGPTPHRNSKKGTIECGQWNLPQCADGPWLACQVSWGLILDISGSEDIEKQVWEILLLSVVVFCLFLFFGKATALSKVRCAFPISLPSQNGWVMHLPLVIAVITMIFDSLTSISGNAAVMEMVQFCPLRDLLLILVREDIDTDGATTDGAKLTKAMSRTLC